MYAVSVDPPINYEWLTLCPFSVWGTYGLGLGEYLVMELAEANSARIQTLAIVYRACAHHGLPGQASCAFHGMKSVLGNSAQHLWLAEWIAFIICQHVMQKNKTTKKKFKTPGFRSPINHLKFGLVTYY